LTALELIQIRWSEIWPFDLETQEWFAILHEHPAGNVLQAIRLTKSCNDHAPASVFRSLLYFLEKVK
jgi:hypothetical protein